MMSLNDYAQDVGKTVEEIKALCDKIGIVYQDENSMIDETSIILLDNEMQDGASSHFHSAKKDEDQLAECGQG